MTQTQNRYISTFSSKLSHNLSYALPPPNPPLRQLSYLTHDVTDSLTSTCHHQPHVHHATHTSRSPSRGMLSPPIHQHFHRQHATRPATWPHKMTDVATYPLSKSFTNAGISTFVGMHPPTTINHHLNPPYANSATTPCHRHIATTISPQVLRNVTNMSPVCHHGQTCIRHRLDKWYQEGIGALIMGNLAITRQPPFQPILAHGMQLLCHRHVSELSPDTYRTVTIFTLGITLVYNKFRIKKRTKAGIKCVSK